MIHILRYDAATTTPAIRTATTVDYLVLISKTLHGPEYCKGEPKPLLRKCIER